MDSVLRYVSEHIDDFENGVDCAYVLERMNSLGSLRLMCKELHKYCDARRIRTNGRRITVYKLKSDAFKNAEKPPSKYKDVETQTML